MNRFYFSLCILFFLVPGLFVNGQSNNVGIGTVTPDASAVLDIFSNTQGVLVPRVTTQQRNAIPVTATSEGLLVYDTDLGCFYYYNPSTTNWVSLCQAGPAGPTGPQGVAGANGVAGGQGPQGVTGPQGAQGQQGVAGVQGQQGVAGANGAAGPAGANGATGPQGPAGNNGADGATGPQGPAGADGATGAQGPAGNDGANGATGPQGVTGATGPQGATGADGVTGPQGATGNDGATGPQGTTGNNGATGADGATGATGPAGANGSNGTNGATGATGATGANGSNGANGATGANGSNGATGATGPAGANGANGANGSNGAAGATGATGPVGCGTADYVIKSTGTSATCSIIYDNGTTVGINNANPGVSHLGAYDVDKLNVYSTTTSASGGVGAVMVELANASANGIALGAENTNGSDAYNAMWGVSDYTGSAYAPSGIFGQCTSAACPGYGGNFSILYNGSAYAAAAVYGLSAGTSGNGAGGVFISNSPSASADGIYAQVPNTNGWAGYFIGYVYSSDNFLASDKNLKENIKSVSGILEKLKQVNVYTYNFKHDLAEDYGFPEGIRYGVIAQEVEQVFPQLIKDGQLTARLKVNDPSSKINSPVERKTMNAKTVNYTGLIPILLEAIKEQQQQIDNLNQRLQQIEKK